MLSVLAITALTGAVLRVEDRDPEGEEALERFRLLQGMGDPVGAWLAWAACQSDPKGALAEAGWAMGHDISIAKTLEEVRDRTVQMMALSTATGSRSIHGFIEIPRHFHGRVTPLQTVNAYPVFGKKKNAGTYGERAIIPFNISQFWSEKDQASCTTLSWDTTDPSNARVLIAIGADVTLNLQIRPFVVPPSPAQGDWDENSNLATRQASEGSWDFDKLKIAMTPW